MSRLIPLSHPIPEGLRTERFVLRLITIHDLVRDFHGSISAEHGLGQAKIDEITRYKSPAELDAMRAIKRALDPRGILNPGKMLPEPAGA